MLTLTAQTTAIYYFNKGRHQEKANELEGLIPAVGHCFEWYLELYRVAGQAYRDLHENGGVNNHLFSALHLTLCQYSQALMGEGLSAADLESIAFECWDIGETGYCSGGEETEALFEQLMDVIINLAWSRHKGFTRRTAAMARLVG